ncbi:MAG: hypothetical protein OXF88_18850, partial [Rhodobacteraceae bacterium]|nr:hypothetical protein [Paracoccaceae bacterium]
MRAPVFEGHNIPLLRKPLQPARVLPAHDILPLFVSGSDLSVPDRKRRKNCTKDFVCRRDNGKPVPAQLHELGQAREMTQITVGAALNVKQPAVAMLERR